LGGSLYVLSWGLNLAKPNTYFWDDWFFLFGVPKAHMNDYFVETGLPPWRAVIDRELIEVGPWTLRVLTFAMMFAAAWFAFHLVQSVGVLQSQELRLFAVVFLVLPTFAARISLSMFGYTTSWFLFLGAWWLVTRLKSWRACVVALPLFVWSFMTHSLLIFIVVPVAHLLWLGFKEPQGGRRRLLFGMSATLALLPVLYLWARSVWWAPLPEWVGYHQPTREGFVRGSIPILLSLAALGYLLWRTRRRRPSAFERSVALTASGSLLFFLGLFPYMLNRSSYHRWVDVFALNSDWGNRNQLLAPLGAALLVVGMASVVRRPAVGWLLVAGFVGLNLFTGVQFLLDAIKKDQIREIMGTELRSSLDGVQAVVIDRTKKFNGKHSTYRPFEFNGLAVEAGIVGFAMVKDDPCTSGVTPPPLYIESDQSFVQAVFTLDPEISMRLGECPGSD
jgi:hypothetical protein